MVVRGCRRNRTGLAMARMHPTPVPPSRYEGSGLVRHVWLHAAPGLLNIPLLGGVFVAAEVVGEINAQGTLAAGANVTARTQVANNGSVETEATVTSVVLDAAGTVVGQASVSVSVAANAVADAQVSIALTSPSLWAPDHAYLYTLLTTIEVGSVLSDNATTRFGVRQVCESICMHRLALHCPCLMHMIRLGNLRSTSIPMPASSSTVSTQRSRASASMRTSLEWARH